MAWSPEIQKYDKDSKKDPEDADEVEEVTDELVVVVLQLLLGVPAIVIVRHLLRKLLTSWSLKRHVCSRRVLREYWQEFLNPHGVCFQLDFLHLYELFPVIKSHVFLPASSSIFLALLVPLHSSSVVRWVEFFELVA